MLVEVDEYETGWETNRLELILLVTLKTKLVTAKIIDTIIDEQPLAIFSLNKVLPEELFKLAPTPAPAPAPAPEADADSLAPSKKKHRSPQVPATPFDSLADAPDEDAVDHIADNNKAVGYNWGRFVVVIFALWFDL
ncbi:unnamed protein product [Fraxinus pennsylvanica]|uniref:Uncharacterized protein n=1 Tax=Fraxinus pennsylvanica TaxID=56036 RepID=A0AAD2DLZ4_9LAMI|nr:unnamed protein product [Fraxinus pennsylvanica]